MGWGQILVGLGVVCGALMAAQGAINGRLASGIGGPVQAALISFSVGTAVLLAANVAMGNRFELPQATGNLPWWVWIGGVLGAVVVGTAALAVPRIGVAAWIAAFIAGQLGAAVLYDQFGAFGQAVRPATPLRLLGVGFLLLGVYMVRRF